MEKVHEVLSQKRTHFQNYFHPNLLLLIKFFSKTYHNYVYIIYISIKDDHAIIIQSGSDPGGRGGALGAEAPFKLERFIMCELLRGQ